MADVVLMAARSANRRAEYWKAESQAANIEIERLREALEAVEWVNGFCPACCAMESDGEHHKHCSTGNALRKH